MILYCIRHGEAEHNLNHTMNGDPSKQIHLTEAGKKQASEAAEKLKEIQFDVIITSEFPRCKETTKILNKYHNLPLIIDKRINDTLSGVEGQTLNVYIKEREKAAKEQGTDIFNAVINDGESFENEKMLMSG